MYTMCTTPCPFFLSETVPFSYSRKLQTASMIKAGNHEVEEIAPSYFCVAHFAPSFSTQLLQVVPSSPAVAASETVAPPAPPSPTPPASSPTPPVPTAPMTYASLAKSWATVAAVGGDVAAPSVSTAGGAPASASVVAGVGVSSGNGHAATPASNGGWGMPDATATSGTALVVEQTIPQPGSGGGQGSARPSPTPGKVRLVCAERVMCLWCVDGEVSGGYEQPPRRCLLSDE